MNTKLVTQSLSERNNGGQHHKPSHFTSFRSDDAPRSPKQAHDKQETVAPVFVELLWQGLQ